VGSLFVVLAFSALNSAGGAVGILVTIGNVMLAGAAVFALKAVLRRWRALRRDGLHAAVKPKAEANRGDSDLGTDVEMASVKTGARSSTQSEQSDSFSFVSPMHAKGATRPTSTASAVSSSAPASRPPPPPPKFLTKDSPAESSGSAPSSDWVEKFSAKKQRKYWT
jgi:hypothetical protein